MDVLLPRLMQIQVVGAITDTRRCHVPFAELGSGQQNKREFEPSSCEYQQADPCANCFENAYKTDANDNLRGIQQK